MRRGVVAGLLERALGKSAGGFDVLNVVQEHQGLQRRCRGWPCDGADFSVRGVEGDHVRRREGAFPIRVERAAIEFFAVVLLECLRGCGRAAVVTDFAPQVARRVRIDARAAEAVDEEAAGFEGVVADEFGRQPEARAAGEEAVVRVAALVGEFRRNSRQWNPSFGETRLRRMSADKWRTLRSV